MQRLMALLAKIIAICSIFSFSALTFADEVKTVVSVETEIQGENPNVTMALLSRDLANHGDLQPLSSKCQIVFVIEEVGYFDSKWAAEDFCKKIHNGYRFQNRCFVRQLDRNFWEGNFTHRGVFTGNRFDDIFGQYRNYIWDSDIFTRDSFNHRSRIFNCSRDPY